MSISYDNGDCLWVNCVPIQIDPPERHDVAQCSQQQLQPLMSMVYVCEGGVRRKNMRRLRVPSFPTIWCLAKRVGKSRIRLCIKNMDTFFRGAAVYGECIDSSPIIVREFPLCEHYDDGYRNGCRSWMQSSCVDIIKSARLSSLVSWKNETLAWGLNA